MYRLILRVLFLFDPEKVHHFSMSALRMACQLGFLDTLIRKSARPEKQHSTKVFNLQFRNPVGLAAGFDKNALYLKEMDALCFGFVEIGTVTPLPQSGNDKPRLFRLPKDKALINRMGFNNDGMDIIAQRLKSWASHPLNLKKDRMIIGGNIGKNKQTANEEAWKDYAKCFDALHPYVDYFVVNVSSPNTPGLRELQDKQSLHQIFAILQQKNRLLPKPRPLLLKIAPDLNQAQLDDIIQLSEQLSLDGLIVSNTSITREGLIHSAKQIQAIGNGGLSGKPVQAMSTSMIRSISEKSNKRITLIGSGGIFTAFDAREKMDGGASLVQVWTGFVYEGPFIVKKICNNL